MSEKTYDTSEFAMIPRERVAQEMDYWRDFMFAKVKENSGGGRNLHAEELIICAILASASLRERDCG